MSFIDFIWHYILPLGGLGSFLFTVARASKIEVEKVKSWGFYAMRLSSLSLMTAFYWYLVVEYATSEGVATRFETACLVFYCLLALWFLSELVQFFLEPSRARRREALRTQEQELEELKERTIRASVTADVLERLVRNFKTSDPNAGGSEGQPTSSKQ